VSDPIGPGDKIICVDTRLLEFILNKDGVYTVDRFDHLLRGCFFDGCGNPGVRLVEFPYMVRVPRDPPGWLRRPLFCLQRFRPLRGSFDWMLDEARRAIHDMPNPVVPKELEPV
jgi:hypothetical protein